MRHNFRKLTAVVFAVIMTIGVLTIVPFTVNGLGTANDIVTVAQNEVGVSGSPNKYTYWLGSIGGSYSYYWCHAFVSWCANQAGVGDKVPKTASCKTGVDWFKNREEWKDRNSGYTPKAGDIIYFDYGSNGTYDHVGIVTSSSGGRVYTIEGNARNQVKINGGYTNGYSLSNTDILGYGTPSYSDSNPNPPTNVRLDRSQVWYDIQDTITLYPHADGATYYWISVLKDRHHIVKQLFTEVFSFKADQYGQGDYEAWITAGNSAGDVDSNHVFFSIGGNADYSKIYTERDWYELSDTVSISVESKNAKGQCLGIDKEGVGRVFTGDTNTTYYCSANDLGVGNYTAYFTVFNSTGYIDTERIKFSIIDDTANYRDIKVSKEVYNVNEIVNISVDTVYAKRQIIGIDKQGQGRIITENTGTEYTIFASSLGVGSYTAYFSVYNNKGFTDTKTVSFSIIDVPATYTNIYTSKQIYLLTDKVSISVDTLYADGQCLGIDKKGVGRVFTRDTDSTYTFLASDLGLGEYSAYFTVFNSKGFTDTQTVRFTIVERYSSIEDHGLGDVNCDGEVNITDATALQRYLASFIDFNDKQLAVADTDGDGRVSITDVTQIQKYLARLIPALG